MAKGRTTPGHTLEVESGVGVGIGVGDGNGVATGVDEGPGASVSGGRGDSTVLALRPRLSDSVGISGPRSAHPATTKDSNSPPTIQRARIPSCSFKPKIHLSLSL